MTKIPEPINTIAALIDKAHESVESRPRPHMGCSMLGHPCDRYLWLNFRWAVIEKFNGRMLRLFRRGHNEEETIISDLVKIGVKIVSTQARVDFGSHVSGSVDAVVENLPEASSTTHLAEFKTHGEKSFNELAKNGVEKAKPQHFSQMQVYMLGLGLTRALYLAVNKNTDAIHTERIKFDEAVASKFVERGRRLALSERMPPPLSIDPSWYQCKFCPAHNFCHVTKITKEVNCRTCAHATPLANSTWHCVKWDDTIPYKAQLEGCGSHVLHPDLVPWEMIDGDGVSAVYLVDGQRVVNGEGGVSSKELVG